MTREELEAKAQEWILLRGHEGCEECTEEAVRWRGGKA